MGSRGQTAGYNLSVLFDYPAPVRIDGQRLESGGESFRQEFGLLEEADYDFRGCGFRCNLVFGHDDYQENIGGVPVGLGVTSQSTESISTDPVPLIVTLAFFASTSKSARASNSFVP